MITQNQDNSLTYTLPDGTSAKVRIFDSNYDDVFEVFSKQQNALRGNAAKVVQYNLLLDGAQAQINKGVNVPAPTKPLMELVDDQGKDTQVPFVPPLADLIPSTIPVFPSGGIAATGPTAPPDYLKLIYNMVDALYKDKFPQT
jgi:hypothetical protein